MGQTQPTSIINQKDKNILIMTDKLDECDFSDQGGVLICV